jgi:hypothetical protein
MSRARSSAPNKPSPRLHLSSDSSSSARASSAFNLYTPQSRAHSEKARSTGLYYERSHAGHTGRRTPANMPTMSAYLHAWAWCSSWPSDQYKCVGGTQTGSCTGLTCPGLLDLEAARDLAMHTAEVLEVAPFLAPAHRKGRGVAAFSAEVAVWN